MPAPGEEKEEKSFSFVDKRRRSEEEPSSPPGARAQRPSEEKPGRAPESAEESEAGAEDDADQLKAPPIDFSTFVLSLASNAVYCLGGFQDPVSGKTSVNLGQAKQSIDILSMIEEKTRGNLTAEEANLIKHMLYDLRMKFVEALRK